MPDLKEEQIPGVKLEIALILNNMGRLDRAIEILTDNLENLDLENSVYSDSEFLLAQIYVKKKDYTN